MSTMDDETERTLRIKIGGRWFHAKPFGQGQIMALTMIKGMKPTAVFSVLSGLVKSSLGEDAQGEVLTMLATQEIDEHQLIAILSDVVKAAQDIEKGVEETPVTVQSLDGAASHLGTFGNGG